MASPAQIFASAQSTSDLVKNAMKSAATTKGLKLKKAIPVDQFLLALLEHAVGDEGQRHTASVVLAAKGDTKALVEAARVWMEEMIFPCEWLAHLFYTNRDLSRTVKAAALHRGDGVSGEETPSSDDGGKAICFRRPLSADTEEMHRIVEERDAHNCALSGRGSSSGASTLPPIATSILPSVLHSFADGKEELSARSWELIRNWGSFDLQNLTAGPTNTFLLRIDLIRTFKHFAWWFQATDEPHKYRIMTHLSNFPFSNKRVTFKDHSDSNIPLPDPQIFKLHAALSRVLYASGAGEYFDQVWRSAANLGVLKEDGSSDIGALLSALAL
ncbi:hypothetical protein HWV62_31680 [Athelia sp. TMB]|nr:hypothetical protein HWV62_31680 [Athelia sp. TMB]